MEPTVAGGHAKRSVASLGGPASPEALWHTLAKEYCCKEVAQMALFQCIQVSKGTIRWNLFYYSEQRRRMD